MNDKLNQYSVSLLFIRQDTGNMKTSLRCMVTKRRSEEEALGNAIMFFDGQKELDGFRLSNKLVLLIPQEQLEEKEEESLAMKATAEWKYNPNEIFNLADWFSDKEIESLREYFMDTNLLGLGLSKNLGYEATANTLLEIEMIQLFKYEGFKSTDSRRKFKTLINKINNVYN